MSKPVSSIHFFEYTTSPFSRVQTTLNRSFDLIPEAPPFCTGGKRPIDSGDLFYFDHVASADPSTYHQLASSGTTSGSHISSVTCFETTKVIYTFITDPGVPNYTGNLNGQWAFYLECKESTFDGGCPFLVKRIYAEIYKRNLAGTETFLGKSSLATPTFTQNIRTVRWESSGSMIASDRLVIRIIGEWKDIITTL